MLLFGTRETSAYRHPSFIPDTLVHHEHANSARRYLAGSFRRQFPRRPVASPHHQRERRLGSNDGPGIDDDPARWRSRDVDRVGVGQAAAILSACFSARIRQANGKHAAGKPRHDAVSCPSTRETSSIIAIKIRTGGPRRMTRFPGEIRCRSCAPVWRNWY